MLNTSNRDHSHINIHSTSVTVGLKRMHSKGQLRSKGEIP
jgi:hypothetical protein